MFQGRIWLEMALRQLSYDSRSDRRIFRTKLCGMCYETFTEKEEYQEQMRTGDYEKDRDAFQLSCGHYAHRECIDYFIDDGQVCQYFCEKNKQGTDC